MTEPADPHGTDPSAAAGSQVVHVAGGHGVQVGDYNLQHNLFLPAVEVSWPVRVGAVPPLADCYQVRAEAAALQETALGGGTAVLTQVLAGMGGVGKSQLAAAYAYQQAEEVDLLAWVEALTRDSVVSGYAQAATQLGYRQVGEGEQAARWFLTWLQTATDRTWLVVLDDLADPADLQGLWPSGPRGSAVVTTRRTDAALSGRNRRRITVGLYTAAQARTYLAEKLDVERGAARLREADELAADLGYLPLALAQAAAFLADRGDSCAGYRQRWADRRRRLTDLLPADALADNYRATVAATWSISVQAADRLPPCGLSRPLLEVASMLDPNGLPIELINAQPVTHYLQAHHDGTDSRRPADPTATPQVEHATSTAPVFSHRDRQDALHNLARLSLISLDSTGDQRLVRVHALVQRAATEQLDPVRFRDLAHTAGAALVAIWPQIERDTHFGQLLRANATALADKSGDVLWGTDGPEVLRRLGYSIDDCGLLATAVTYWTDLVDKATQQLGSDHRYTLNARHVLARLWGKTDPARAITAYQALLDDYLRVLGPEDPETLGTRHQLAQWRGQAGDLTGAATAYEQLLQDQIRLLGPGHRDTLKTRYDLTSYRAEAGFTGTTAAYQQLLTDYLRVLHRDHPDVLSVRWALTRWRGEDGDAGGAVTAYEALLDTFVRVLGPDNPNTLGTRDGLANWRGEAGDPAGAAAAYEQLITDNLRILGPDHSATLASRHGLAKWTGEAGDPVGAATAYEQLVNDYIRVLGPDHPHTLSSRHNLARWRAESGNPADATTAAHRLIHDQLRVLGPEHPDTLRTRLSIASWQRQAGDFADAASAFERLVHDCQRILGPNHPYTALARANRASLRTVEQHKNSGPAD